MKFMWQSTFQAQKHTYVHPALEQMSFRVINIATSWWCGSLSSFGFSRRCHLHIANKHEKEFNWIGEMYEKVASLLRSEISYLQKLCRLFSAKCVTLKSGCVSSSSSRTMRTTTTLIRFPMAGSLYSDETMFMIVSKYVSTSPSWWNATIDGSATISASTCRGLLIDRFARCRSRLLRSSVFSMLAFFPFTPLKCTIFSCCLRRCCWWRFLSCWRCWRCLWCCRWLITPTLSLCLIRCIRILRLPWTMNWSVRKR